MLHDAQPIDSASSLFEGNLTKLLDDTKIGRGKYSYVVGMLQDMGCIEQLRRGNAHRQSQWILYDPPSYELFSNTPTSWSGGGKRRGTANDQQIKALNDRITELESTMELLWADYEHRNFSQTTEDDATFGHSEVVADQD